MQALLHRKPWLTVAFLALLLIPLLGQAQWTLTNADCAFPASKHYFNIVADDLPVTAADSMALAKAAAKRPNAYARLRAIDVAESERAYADGHFAAAAVQLEPFAMEEPVDPNLLNQ